MVLPEGFDDKNAKDKDGKVGGEEGGGNEEAEERERECVRE